MVLYRIDFVWVFLNYEWPGTVYETYEIDVSIFGESGITSALGLATVGIPTFLVLPGFLMIVTIGVLWRWITPKGGDYAFNNLVDSLRKPEFWFWVITLSFLIIPIYRFGSKYFGGPRDLLKGYGFVDVIAVWFISIILAGFGFILFKIIKDLIPIARKRILSFYHDFKDIRYIPSSNDMQIETLKKLGRKNLGVYRKRVIITHNGQRMKNYVYLLEPYNINYKKDNYWVSPGILVRWKKERNERENKIFNSSVEQLNKGCNDARVLASKLSKAKKGGWINLSWENTEPINLNGPLLVNTANIEFPSIDARAIVIIEDMLE